MNKDNAANKSLPIMFSLEVCVAPTYKRIIIFVEFFYPMTSIIIADILLVVLNALLRADFCMLLHFLLTMRVL